jgi:cysteinyl-tRNA synthetase
VPLSLRDSLTGEVAPLPPGTDGQPLTMYVCGPTVYDAAHVGHGRTYLYFDVLRRAIHDAGGATNLVMNITDYEDKISVRAKELGMEWQALARREEVRFFEDMDRLRILPPQERPRASEFVPEMIEIGKRLEALGPLRRSEEALVYDPPVAPGRNFAIGDDFAGHVVPEPGIDIPTAATDAREIVVWHRQEAPLAVWSSPWGPGAPGWHLECYAMAHKYLGVPVDLHGGGNDLIFPHHYAENELALALNGTLFARRFLHTGFVTQLHRKMSKSRGNLVPLREALDSAGPDALRWYLLTPPYNARLEWSDRELARAQEEVGRLQGLARASIPVGAGGSVPLEELEALPEHVREAIDDGFQVHRGLDVLREWSDRLGKADHAQLPKGTAPRARKAYLRLEKLLGISMLTEPEAEPTGPADPAPR